MTTTTESKVTNVTLAGLGGQGVLKASDILADVAFSAGLDVKKAEVHGMSQRGGFVNSDVRFGPKVHSPMIPAGKVDLLVLLADDQVEACQGMLADEANLIRTDVIDVEKLPNRRCLNIAMLGVLSTRLDFPVEAWHEAIRRNMKPALHEMNLTSFDFARKLAGV